MNPDQVGDYSEEEQPQSKVGIVTVSKLTNNISQY